MDEEQRDAGDELREFHEARASGVGATDSPKILGLSRWGTALTVYEEATGARPPRPPSLSAWLGKKMQATVGELYSTATGQRLRAVSDKQHFRSKEHPWLVCHLDFRAWGKPLLLVEAKTRAYMTGYGPDGSNEIPAEEFVQIQHEMAVTGATETHLAVLFGHHTFNVYPVPRDQEFIDAMIPKLGMFWTNTQAGVPPEITGHVADQDWLRRNVPQETGDMKQATPEQEKLILRLAAARQQVALALAAEADVEAKVKRLIGEAAGIRGGFGQITWKQTKDGVKTGWEQIATVYANIIEELLQHADPTNEEELREFAKAQAVYESAVGLYTMIRPGSRQFLVKLQGG